MPLSILPAIFVMLPEPHHENDFLSVVFRSVHTQGLDATFLAHAQLFRYNPSRKPGLLFIERLYEMLLPANIRKMLVNGDEWANWGGYHIPVSKEYVVIWTPIGTPMHWKPGTWISHKHQLSFLFPNAWFTIHIGYTQTGSFLSGYCDVVLPNADYTNTAQELIYTDLYIDVVVREDYSVYTKDHEVFDRAAKRYPIVEESRQKSFEVLDWLETQAKNWTGPFTHMPRSLPRTDFEMLSPDEASAILQAVS